MVLWLAQLKLNPQKCHSFTITLKQAPIRHTYFINTTLLRHVAEVRDLGIILDSKLTFSAHVSSVVTKANRSLGLLIRSFQTGFPKQKFDKKALLTAYCANIRSILEFGSVIWSGAAKTHLNRLERVQHKFLMWLACRTRGTDRSVNLEYPRLLMAFNITTLEARREQLDLMFLRNVFIGKVDSTFLVGCFGMHVPRRPTRQAVLFHVPFARVSSVKTGLFSRLCTVANSFLGFSPQVDFLSGDFKTFRSCLLAYIRRPKWRARPDDLATCLFLF